MKSNEILEIFKMNNGILSNKDALQYGITRLQLHRLKEKGEIISVSRGVYTLVDELPDTMYIIQKHCQRGVFSHETALYLHEMSDRTPLKHVMTVPSNYNVTPLKKYSVKFRYVSPDLIELGKIRVKTNYGNFVYVYDVERTICDIINSRSSMDASIVNEAIRMYVATHKKKMAKLMLYANKMGIEKKLIDVMGVLL